jgi:hypothetical protein
MLRVHSREPNFTCELLDVAGVRRTELHYASSETALRESLDALGLKSYSVRPYDFGRWRGQARAAARTVAAAVGAGRAPEFNSKLWFDLKPWLLTLFHGKCGYCETPLGTISPIEVEHFRPKVGATELDGTTRAGYWWLAYDPTNILPACLACNRGKRNRFPVAGEPADGPHASLEDEGALLLNPYVDDPDEHLDFDEAGLAVPQSERGVVTVELLALNRTSLVEARRRQMQYARLALLDADDVERPRRAKRLTEAREPYAAATRYAVERLLRQLGEDDLAEGIDVSPGPADLQAARGAEKRSRKLESFSIERKGHREAYQLRGANRWIGRVEITDFKGIETLTLEFPKDTDEVEPWLVLLGENSSGKSSVLQAVALTLAGQEVGSKIVAKHKNFVRYGQDEATVVVALDGGPQEELIELTIRARDHRVSIKPPEPRSLVAAYGAVRLPGTERAAPKALAKSIHVENLFDHSVPLGDPVDWLLRRTEDQWRPVKRALDRLLPGPGDEILRDEQASSVEVIQAGRTIPLADVSDGYKATIALAVDIMRFFSTVTEDVDDMVGIVILDEIGPHLHPTWKSAIVGQLRTAFPRVRFLATTHDPLCLRGLRGGEVAVMQRDEDGFVLAKTDLPTVEGLRVDQILTSEHFGLLSAADPVLDARLREYSRLRSKPQKSAEERNALMALQDDIRHLQVVGSDPLEQVGFEAIEALLEKRRRDQSVVARSLLAPQALERLAALWQDTGQRRR